MKKYLCVRSLWCNDEWSVKYRGHSFLFFFCRSQQLCRQTGKSEVWRWGGWVWITLKQSDQLKTQHCRALRKSNPIGILAFVWKECRLAWAQICWLWGCFFFFSYKIYLSQEMYQKLHCSWQDKHVASLMASDIQHNAIGHPTRQRLGGFRRGWGTWGLAHHRTMASIMPPSYAIIFALRPISTWEQCKLFKTRFSGLAIIIMMISISVAIASDYLAGNFAAWGRGSSRELTRQVRKGGERKRQRGRENECGHS